MGTKESILERGYLRENELFLAEEIDKLSARIDRLEAFLGIKPEEPKPLDLKLYQL